MGLEEVAVSKLEYVCICLHVYVRHTCQTGQGGAGAWLGQATPGGSSLE